MNPLEMLLARYKATEAQTPEPVSGRRPRAARERITAQPTEKAGAKHVSQFVEDERVDLVDLLERPLRARFVERDD